MHLPEYEKGTREDEVNDTDSISGRVKVRDWRKLSVGRFGYRLSLLVFVFIFGLANGYVMWGPSTNSDVEHLTPVNQITLPESYTLPVSFDNIGPQLLEAGAIDYDRFIQVYERAGQPLTHEQIRILTEGSDSSIQINRRNAYFLLNLLWAFGLANQNSLLDESGPMAHYENVARLASTGGWTIGSKPPMEIYSSTPIITLTDEQQALMEDVAHEVYRPCCNNHTAFADCNHGMAMLGLLEILASQNASADDMFTAAKYVNAFWYPTQSIELAMYFSVQGTQFKDVDARRAVSKELFSSRGFENVHQWLADQNLLGQVTRGGSNCSV